MQDVPAAGLAPGRTIGPFRVASVRAGGAVAEVVDPATQRRSAIKLLPFDLVADAAGWHAFGEFVRKFRTWKHPGIVEIQGIETYDGRPYLLMEYLPQGSLADTVAATGRLPWRVAVQRTIEAGRIIAAAHAAGFVHGSIRPSNLLPGTNGALRVSDFGGGFVRARTGDYCPPESFTGKPADVAGDVYSLGGTFFALLSGHAPFADAATHQDLAKAHATRPLPNVRAGVADIPLRCEVIVGKAMAKNPADRYANVAAFVADLEALLRAESQTPQKPPMRVPPAAARRRRRWALDWQRWLTPIAVVAFLAGATYLSFFRGAKSAPASSGKSAPAFSRPVVQNSIGMSLVELPAATFLQGDPEVADAKPHPVRVTKPYMIGQFEVLQREYEVVTSVNPSRFRDESNPVDMVSWDDAVAYCNRLSELPLEREARRTYRLPTEAEWEFACRAGSPGRFSHGRYLSIENANFAASAFTRTTPARTYPANGFGLFDMHGNVWEWCSDWYDGEYYVRGDAIDPAGPLKGTKRVLRGGSFLAPPDMCRCGSRHSLPPNTREPDVGFRVVCVIGEREQPKR